LLEACIECVGGNAAHCVLQVAKRLGVAVAQRPQNTDGVA